MHCVCLGVVKKIMQLQMSDGNRGKPFYLGAKKATISHQLLLIKPPDIARRLPRSLEDVKHWKATELKDWLFSQSALFSASFEKQIKYTVCFSLFSLYAFSVFACRRNQNFVFRLNFPRRSETC